MTNPLAAEFRDVFTLYIKLGEELTKIMDVGNSEDPQVLADAILKNRECLDRIEQMNSRVLRLSSDWQQHRNNLDQESEKEVRDLSDATRAQVRRLQELCSMHVQKLQNTRDKLQKDLAEIGKGAQYLKSTTPTKNNYPKFIDSLY
jgi:archaellum component FlaC